MAISGKIAIELTVFASATVYFSTHLARLSLPWARALVICQLAPLGAAANFYPGSEETALAPNTFESKCREANKIMIATIGATNPPSPTTAWAAVASIKLKKNPAYAHSFNTADLLVTMATTPKSTTRVLVCLCI